MKLLVNGLLFGFVCTAVCRTQAATVAPSTPSSNDQQQQQQQQQQQEFVNIINLLTSNTQTSSAHGQQTESTTASSTSSTSSNTTSPSSIPSNATGDQQQGQLPSGPPGTQTKCKGVAEATQCFQAAFPDLLSTFFSFVFGQNVDSLLKDLCWKFPKHRQCVEEALMDCQGPQRVYFDVVLAALDYVCSDQGRAAVQEAWPCLSDQSVGRHLRVCSQQIPASSANYGPCRTASNYVSCVSAVFKRQCSLVSAAAVQEFLTATLLPFSTSLNCPTVATTVPTTTTTTTTTTTVDTTTTVPPSTTTEETVTTTTPEAVTTTTAATTTTTMTSTTTSTSSATRECYDCYTGGPGYWPNPFCSDSGHIEPAMVRNVSCKTPCFARVSKGGIYRGCSEGYNNTFSGVFDLNTCVTRGRGASMEIWCFCDHDHCNVQDMRRHFNKYVP